MGGERNNGQKEVTVVRGKEEIEMGGERKRKMDVGRLSKELRKYQREGGRKETAKVGNRRKENGKDGGRKEGEGKERKNYVRDCRGRKKEEDRG